VPNVLEILMTEVLRDKLQLSFGVDDLEYKLFFDIKINGGMMIGYHLRPMVVQWLEDTTIVAVPIVQYKFVGLQFNSIEDLLIFKMYWRPHA
jgi:hypothetical protein